MLKPTLHSRAVAAGDMAKEIQAAMPPTTEEAAALYRLATVVEGLAQTVAELVTVTEEHARYHGAHRPDGGRTL